MSAPAIRHGDLGSHGGPVTATASRTRIVGQLAARLGDPYACTTHPPNVIVEGSPTVRIEGQAAARQGDATDCGATLEASQQAVRIG